MSLTAEATQNSNTIPKRHPTNCTACERSFCKLHLFTLQPATTQKSRLNSQAQAAALLLCSIPSSPPAAAHGYSRIFGAGCAIPPALCPCPQDAGCGMWQLPPAGMQQQPPWSRASAAQTQGKNTPEMPAGRDPLGSSSPPYCWMFKTHRKFTPVVLRHISDAQKQNAKTAA